MPSSAGSPPRIRRTTSSPTTAGSPPIAAPPAWASGSTAAPPIRARSSPATTTRCWRRSPPGRRRRRWRSRGWTGRCASSASAGVSTNIAFVENLLKHPTFLDYTYTTKFIDTTPELFHFSDAPRPGDEDPDLHRRHHRQRPSRDRGPRRSRRPRRGRRSRRSSRSTRRRRARGSCWSEKGAKAVADWMLAQERLLITDTTMRDGHQSLLATRMRSYRHDPGGAGLCRQSAAALQRRMLGRRHLRRRLPLPAGMPVAAAARPARARCRT